MNYRAQFFVKSLENINFHAFNDKAKVARYGKQVY